jgi:hypothetical protein
MKKTYHGSCHCGRVRFECKLELGAGTTRCNCTFCRKARFWMALAKADEFKLLAGADALTDYQHTPPGRPEPFLNLLFCSHCGVRAFTRGGDMPGMGRFYAVNLGCLDDATDAELAQAPIHFADGRHEAWPEKAKETFL